MKYRIGLDIGIASVGWAVIKNNENDEACGIVARGVRAFDVPQNPKDGGSLKAERRGFRSIRRTLRRRKVRIAMIKQLCEQTFGIAYQQILQQKELPDIYEIRFQALSRKLSTEEFSRLLLHFAHRRGFLSNRKETAKTGKDGKILKGITENEQKLQEKGYATVGEYYFKEFIVKGESVRNKSEKYDCTFNRQTIEDEIKLIFSKQREFGFDKTTISTEFESKFTDLFNKQIPYDVGPANPSPYATKSGSLYQDMLGVCSFDGNFRTYQATNAGEKFKLWNNINNLTLSMIEQGRSKEQELSLSDKQILANYCFKKAGKITYSDVRKILKLNDNIRFKHLIYSKRTKANRYVLQELAREEVEKKVFVDLKGRAVIKKAFKNDLDKLSYDEIDTIIVVLQAFHSNENLLAALNGGLSDGKFKINPDYIDTVLGIEMPESRPMHLSSQIIYQILPYMEKGEKYHKAMESAGYNHVGKIAVDKKVKLSIHDIEKDIRNPVVLRSVSQTIKVINAIVQKYGFPSQVIIEVAREMAKTFDERNKARKSMDENREHNERIKERIKQLGRLVPSGEDIVKYKLAEEQNWEDPYSGGKKIDASKLFESNYVQVDHIIPYSKCFDDSYNNKVLVHASSNQNKGNRTPLQFLTGEQAQMFINWVKTARLSARKKTNLLMVEPYEVGMKERHLKDTQYITRLVLNFLKQYLYVLPSKHKEPIKAIKGMMTSYFRKRFQLSKFRDTDEHHATDAVIIACFTDKLVQQITNFHQMRESFYQDKDGRYICKITKTVSDDQMKNIMGKFEDKFPEPWTGFRKELDDLNITNPISVSRMPTRKITGSGQAEAIRGYVEEVDEKGIKTIYTITRVPLTKLTLDSNGKIKNYFNPQSDILLYNKLKELLRNNPTEEDFKNFRKPLTNGNDGNIVRKVKIKEKVTMVVKLDKVGGAAANGSMVRIDVFAKGDADKEKFYMVPIYAADFYKPELPNKAITAKPYDQWPKMEQSKSYNFKFSLYPKDLFYFEKVDSKTLWKEVVEQDESGELKKVKKPKEVTSGNFYYRTADISNGSISGFSQNGEWEFTKLGIQGLKVFKKMEIDILGNIKDAPFEPRDTRTLLRQKAR